MSNINVDLVENPAIQALIRDRAKFPEDFKLNIFLPKGRQVCFLGSSTMPLGKLPFQRHIYFSFWIYNRSNTL